jgi:hypothetical protein
MVEIASERQEARRERKPEKVETKRETMTARLSGDGDRVGGGGRETEKSESESFDNPQ